MSRPTPETDEAERMAFAQEYMVPTDFARRLERERDQAREEANRLDGAYEDATNYYARIIELTDERDEAREALSKICEKATNSYFREVFTGAHTRVPAPDAPLSNFESQKIENMNDNESCSEQINDNGVHELRKQHLCPMRPTMDLRWKVIRLMGLEERKLEQAFSCRECGEVQWREVPEVKEEAK